MDDASSLRCGCVVHYYCLRCTSIHRGYTSNFTEGKWFSPGLFTWREGSQASRLTDALGKGSFHIILFKARRFFMLNKCFQKIKIHPMKSSAGSHGVCRIKVMMAAFLATLYSIVKLWAKREPAKYMRRYRITENVIKTKLRSKFFLTPVYFTTVSSKRIETNLRLSICCPLIAKFKVK